MRVSLPSVLDPDPKLIVEGGVEGPTAAFLEYIRESPVGRMTGGSWTFAKSMRKNGEGIIAIYILVCLWITIARPPWLP